MKPIPVEVRIVKLLKERKLHITTMESCTSGLLECTITDVEGSSDITEGGYITYSNRAKIEEGVPSSIIDKFGVYSSNTAVAMALTCKMKKKADIGIGVTGTLSNVDPNNKDSISGEVYFCINYSGNIYTEKITLPKFADVENEYTIRHIQKKYIVKHILNKLEDTILKNITI